ncbi:origin recognition complex subunit 1 [Haematococcus lacustris]|uniref:Origin recognition complex subunit 1 n=1 Tax=Haematococcus lacustris TaxID=44745 RepID=A0A699YYQ3_HAELA|nr:origin recognition complex subunit 1 [Haematococcus lacustris]
MMSGSWLCPSCARGEAPAASRPLRMAYEKYLFASRDKPVLTLGRIMAFVKAHHGAREVFQTAAEHYESVQCIFDKAHVCKPQDYDSTSGPDVFLCEYEYDELWKRFRRCSLKATTTLAPSQRTKKGARVCAVDTDSEDDSDEEFNAAAEQLSSDDEDRDTEKAHMHRFVSEAVGDEGQGTGPGVMYVCGVPGTGKTACINEVIAANKASAQAAGVQLISLNALSLPTPGHVYSKLWEKVAGQRAGPARALAALEAHFSAGATAQGRGRCMTLLVVDEIDVLITKDQSVLYNLFEWPMRPGARLAVIGISNTHDLDERVLPRISSRLANAKLAFNPYSVDQLRQIIGQRVAAAGCGLLFKEAAIQWVARKVAATTGDVRRALELLRRAVEVAEAARCKANAPPLTAASSPAELKGFITFLRACSQLEKTALVGLLLEMRATNRPQVSVQALHHRLVSHLSLLVPDAAAVQPGTLNRALAVLAAKRLLLASPSWQVTLAVHKDDVCSAIKEDTQLVALHTQLA